jgi:hypothetical protein
MASKDKTVTRRVVLNTAEKDAVARVSRRAQDAVRAAQARRAEEIERLHAEPGASREGTVGALNPTESSLVEPITKREDTLAEYLMKEGWQLAPSKTRLSAPTRLNASDGLLPIAHRVTPWGSELFVEIPLKAGSARGLSHDAKQGFERGYIVRPSVAPTCWGILALVDGARNAAGRVDEYVHVMPEPRGTDSPSDVDLESVEFNDKYQVECSSDRYAYQVLTPNVMALLIDTYQYPDYLLSKEPVSQANFYMHYGVILDSVSEYWRYPLPERFKYGYRFEYHVEPGLILVSRCAKSEHSFGLVTNPNWTRMDEFILLEAQFQRLFATLPITLRGGQG